MNRTLLALRAALDNLGANPLRTLLSTLGVIIGVASLVAILALGDGLEAFSRAEIAGTTDLQTVTVAPRTEEVENGVRVRIEDPPRFDEAAVAELRDRIGDRVSLARLLIVSTRAGVAGSTGRAGDTTRHAVLVAATDPTAREQLEEGLRAGRFFTAAEQRGGARLVVVPETLSEWYGVSPDSLPGRVVALGESEWEIVGVRGGDDRRAVRLIVPLGEAVTDEIAPPGRPVSLAIRADRVEDVEPVTREVEGWLETRYGSVDRFVVASNRARAAQARQGMLVFKLIMGAIAGIALLVGGIGIMNILLASVFERTREIGIRKAAGARQRDILIQFLAEAVTITGAGSLVGVVTGLVGAFAITAAVRQLTEAPVYAAFTWGSVLIAAAAALLVGLVFGTYPARRAARLSPIEAIRHE